MMIFDDIARTDPNPKSHRESTFQFMNRCRSDALDKVRVKLQSWLDHYPSAHRAELCKRFRADFNPPFYELLLHEMMIAHNHSVTVHPTIGDKGATPDFAISTSSGMTIILEATIWSDDEETDSTSSRMNLIYDSINDMKCREFFVAINDVRLIAPEQPSSKRIVSFLRKTIAEYDPTAYPPDCQYHQLPRFSYNDDRVEIDFMLIPKKPEAWDRDDVRTIGAYCGGCTWGDDSVILREKLRTKAMSYGKLMHPFVLALNIINSSVGDYEEIIYGTLNEKDAMSGLPRKQGFWGTANAPKHTRVSAVIVGEAFHSNVGRFRPCLYRNPWANHPLPGDFWKLSSAHLVDGNLVRENDMMTAGDLLGLPPDWPGDLFPDRRKNVHAFE